MKIIDVLPCDERETKISFPDIPVFANRPSLREELEKGIITEDEAVRLIRRKRNVDVYFFGW